MSAEINPQLEDGYTRIANELFDAILAFPFSARQLKVLMTIIRKTYGYNKKLDDMSSSQISNLCGLARSHVTAVLGELASMNVITKQSGKFGSIIGINKKCDEWRDTKTVQGGTESVSPDESQSDVERGTDLVQGGTESVQVGGTDSVHTKDNLPKDKKHTQCVSEEEDLAFKQAWAMYPKRDGGNSKAAALKAWQARMKAGVEPREMLAGVQRYATYCESRQMAGTRYVKQAASFFGPDGHYLEPWGQSQSGADDWWVNAGFVKRWQAENAGCTKANAWLWRDGRPTKRLAGVEIEPWETVQ